MRTSAGAEASGLDALVSAILPAPRRCQSGGAPPVTLSAARVAERRHAPHRRRAFFIDRGNVVVKITVMITCYPLAAALLFAACVTCAAQGRQRTESQGIIHLGAEPGRREAREWVVDGVNAARNDQHVSRRTMVSVHPDE